MAEIAAQGELERIVKLKIMATEIIDGRVILSAKADRPEILFVVVINFISVARFYE